MADKLQELTDKLYKEGLSKGREEGEQILEQAKAEAKKLSDESREAAEHTMKKAAKDAEQLREKAAADIRTASQQSLTALRKDIENILIGNIIDEKISAAASDPDFIRKVILATAENFSAGEPQDISLTISEKLRPDLEAWVAGELKAALGKEVQAEFSKKISGGFTIGPKDGSYYISLTDDTFKELIGEYLRPVTKKLLFGE
ncbi:MAG: hypothetical protein IJU69_02980 [Bacteroidales bacterium]|nr:hypothetical protein [Bacteroidales bacterium]